MSANTQNNGVPDPFAPDVEIEDAEGADASGGVHAPDDVQIEVEQVELEPTSTRLLLLKNLPTAALRRGGGGDRETTYRSIATSPRALPEPRNANAFPFARARPLADNTLHFHFGPN